MFASTSKVKKQEEEYGAHPMIWWGSENRGGGTVTTQRCMGSGPNEKLPCKKIVAVHIVAYEFGAVAYCSMWPFHRFLRLEILGFAVVH
jgi:hypothetical protein